MQEPKYIRPGGRMGGLFLVVILGVLGYAAGNAMGLF